LRLYAVACGARFPHRLTGVVAVGQPGPYRELGPVLGRAVPDAPLIAARMPNADVRAGEDGAHTPSRPTGGTC
jgi:hypothetical protein